eukprot:4140623-Pyramimonas_sp.AAC.1
MPQEDLHQLPTSHPLPNDDIQSPSESPYVMTPNRESPTAHELDPQELGVPGRVRHLVDQEPQSCEVLSDGVTARLGPRSRAAEHEKVVDVPRDDARLLILQLLTGLPAEDHLRLREPRHHQAVDEH